MAKVMPCRSFVQSFRVDVDSSLGQSLRHGTRRRGLHQNLTRRRATAHQHLRAGIRHVMNRRERLIDQRMRDGA